MTTRLMFVGTDRISDLCLCLQFDHFLTPAFDKTIVYHRSPQQEVTAALDRFQIDYNNFEFVQDAVFEQTVRSLGYQREINWLTANDDMAWIRQQFYKLLALDLCTDEQVVISDSDSFRIVPHTYFVDGVPVLYHDNDFVNDPATWGTVFEELTGLPTTKTVYVSEFFPILKSDWRACTALIEQRSGKHWLQSFIDALQRTSTDQGLHFSEYQFLSNWILHLRPNTPQVKQSRYWPDTRNPLSQELTRIDLKQYNCLNIDSKTWHKKMSLDEVEEYYKIITDLIGKNSP